jgi:hypothetical protein
MQINTLVGTVRGEKLAGEIGREATGGWGLSCEKSDMICLMCFRE